MLVYEFYFTSIYKDARVGLGATVGERERERERWHLELHGPLLLASKPRILGEKKVIIMLLSLSHGRPSVQRKTYISISYLPCLQPLPKMPGHSHQRLVLVGPRLGFSIQLLQISQRFQGCSVCLVC